MELVAEQLTAQMQGRPALRAFLELIVCVAVFASVGWFYESPDVDIATGNPSIILTSMGVVFWFGVRMRPAATDRSPWVAAIERAFIGTGLILLLNGMMAYTLFWYPPPVYLIVLCGLAAGCLLVLLSKLAAQPQESILLVGDQLGGAMFAAFGSQIIGVIAPGSDVLKDGLTDLGEISRLSGVLNEKRPSRVLVASTQDQLLSQPALVQYQQSGAVVESTATMYERTYLRVSSESLRPTDVLSASPLAASPAMMSLQATYSNLIGLFFVIILAPLMLVLAIVSRMAAGPGTMLDRVECAGFEGIPFYRLRFRLRSVKTNEITWVGKIISSLHLTGLPQLINLVRGEMAMFGPSPARLAFATRLEQEIPFYSHRMAMRPGLLGWAQTHLMDVRDLREEGVQLEYDLYYVKHCTPSLDLEILLRMLFRAPHHPSRSRRA